METLRMPITKFLDLRDWLVNRSLLKASKNISVEQQLIIFLWIVGHEASTREAQEHFQHSGETISRYFHHVLQSLGPLYDVFEHHQTSFHIEFHLTGKRCHTFKICVELLIGRIFQHIFLKQNNLTKGSSWM
jgi:hypothetical protein